jgi:DNA-binding transcriptional ArsR family regulator
MQEPSTPEAAGTLARAERLVILQLASAQRGRSREQLIRALRGTAQQAVDEAIASLAAVGLVLAEGRSVRQSSALERMDALGFIEV